MIEERYEEPVNVFQLWMKQAGYADTTKKEYVREVRNFLAYLDGTELKHVKKLTIVSYLVQEKEQLSDRARNRSLAALRSFFKALIDFELAVTNPAQEVKKSKTERNRKPIYLEQELLALTINYIEGKYQERNIALLLLMAYCGLRVGEVHRLNISNYDEEKATITVLGKGRKWNEIPLAPEVNQYMKRVVQQRIQPYRPQDEAFFISQKGRRLSIRQIQKIISEMFKQLKAEHAELQGLQLSCHKLRHSFATLMLRNQVDIRVVKELMGHSSIDTTMIYTHIHDEEKKHAVASIRMPDLQTEINVR
ncbi:tyrosine-type recombinase/integrase [Paenibacillus camelliae]|uniref:tyrosine-type recombinase/integrase n=1 Tax=Paenibacillus camelliae TaxID=512410 RepID=UPI00203FEE23|nr:tyrosine-type recombinase/integrase [Paenibacillus camelliae]MCM3631784.1 tyrosine-type recombinase/integrase [Paenibacillus camelliae]